VYIDAYRVVIGGKALLDRPSGTFGSTYGVQAKAEQLSGIIITVGIVLATISAPRRKTPAPAFKTQASLDTAPEWLSDSAQYFAGIGLLSLALFLSAWLGLWQEETYKRYGKQWKEALFYSVSHLSPPLAMS
jgi:UDP-xylose/UDP-N-acetylglucosamine transporter B4